MPKSKMHKVRMWHKFYECSCGSEGIMVSNEEWDSETEPEIYLAFFHNGFYSKQLTLWDRLRWCFHIVKTGIPWNDMVILNKGQAKSLGEDLIKWSKKTPKEYPKGTTVTQNSVKLKTGNTKR